MILPCQNEEDFQHLLAESQTGPVLLLKHSTRCPISAAAQAQYSRFAEEHPTVACWQVLVVEQRALSLLIASQVGVTHQSPQAILFVAGKPVWHASHYSITATALAAAVAG